MPQIKYQIHVILMEIISEEDNQEVDFLYEEEAVGCKDEYETLDEALEDFKKNH